MGPILEEHDVGGELDFAFEFLRRQWCQLKGHPIRCPFFVEGEVVLAGGDGRVWGDGETSRPYSLENTPRQFVRIAMFGIRSCQRYQKA